MPNVYADLPTGTSSSSVVSLDINAPERKQAVYSGPINPTVQSLYSVALLAVPDGDVRVLAASNLDPAARTGLCEYFFTVPPKTHEFTEPFATTIIATQNGGKFVETHGTVTRTIRISGTTGLRPNKFQRAASTIPLFGSALSQLQDNLEVLRGLDNSDLPEEEATGFDDIIFLRNIFRHYSDLKGNSPDASTIIMVWRNAKDGDYWVVEPIEFKLSQDASSPMTYTYNIQFTALSRFTSRIRVPEDPLANVLSTQKFFSRIQEYNRAFKNTFLLLSTQVSRLEGLGVFAQTQLLSPLINTIQGLGVIKNTTTRFGSKIANNATTLLENLITATNQLAEHPSVSSQDNAVRAMRRLIVTVSRLLSEPAIRNTVAGRASNTIARAVQSYNGSGGSPNSARIPPRSGGSSSYLGNEPLPSAVGQTLVHPGEDIRAVAARALGNRARWQVLVTLNNLVPPYIAATSSPGVLGPGDPILFPDKSANAASAGAVSNSSQEDTATNQGLLGPIQQAYGRDLRLKSVAAANSGLDLTDLDENQSGDVDSVVGIPNVEQAVVLKFLTERGELPQHPSFGARFPIGSKATNVAFNEYRIQTEATFYSDTRIKQVRNMRFQNNADTMSVKATLELIGTSDTFDTSISLRGI